MRPAALSQRACAMGQQEGPAEHAIHGCCAAAQLTHFEQHWLPWREPSATVSFGAEVLLRGLSRLGAKPSLLKLRAGACLS